MLEYPTRLPAVLVARIEQAIADTELAWLRADYPEYQILILGDPISEAQFVPRPPARDPVHVVLVIAEAIVQALSDPLVQAWTAVDRRHAADRLLEQLIAHTHDRKNRRGYDLHTFRRDVHRQLEACAWWQQFQVTLHDRTLREQAAPSLHATRTYPKRATWFREQLTRRKLKAYGFSLLMGSSHRTVKKILAGDPVQDAVLDRLADALECSVRDIPSH